MRKVIASVFVTLDGYMVGPNEDISWVMNNFNEEMAKYAGDLMNSMDTILLGRVTYEIMTKAWPAQTVGPSHCYRRRKASMDRNGTPRQSQTLADRSL